MALAMASAVRNPPVTIKGTFTRPCIARANCRKYPSRAAVEAVSPDASGFSSPSLPIMRGAS